MAPAYEGRQLRALAEVIRRGHLYKGLKPVNWCLDCASALAEAEVEYEDKTSPAIDVRFPVVEPADLQKRLHIADSHLPAAVAIWTTTQWALPANQAVAPHPDFEYALVECDAGLGREHLLLARELVTSVMQRLGVTQWKTLASVHGKDLEGLKLRHPFYERVVPVVLGEHVTLDAGTGAVHTAPGHGHEDFALGQQYGLKIDNPVDNHGVFVPGTELFAGEHVFKANEHRSEEHT